MFDPCQMDDYTENINENEYKVNAESRGESRDYGKNDKGFAGDR